MCGIFGLIAKGNQPVDRQVVENATDRLAHRGPDGRGVFFAHNFGLGNRRLAIRDLSPEAAMPMTRANCTITYNGEIYNTKTLRQELESLGHTLRTTSDTELILAAYQQWGIDCQQKLSGMWAFIIYDAEQQTIFCSRDRYGIKPFFIWEYKKGIAFASEIKSFLEIPAWESQLNHQLAADFVFAGQQHHTNESLFKSVSQLPAGHYLNINIQQAKVAPQPYFNIEDQIGTINLDKKASAEALLKLLQESVQRHLLSDVPVGTALSGGLDSSTILSLRQQLEPQANLEAVSYFAEDPAVNEKEYVDAMAEKTGANIHAVVFPFSEGIEKLDAVISNHDEPLMSGSLIAQWEVFRKAKNAGLKVMLDGQGADEILGGYATFYRPLIQEQKKNAPWSLLQNLWGIYQTNKNVLGKIKSKSIDYQYFLTLPTTSTLETPNGFSKYEVYLCTKGILPYLLHFEDRNSMAHSVESRVPFLDPEVVAFCLSLTADLKIEKGVRKKILRTAMQAYLPNKILNRTDKIGFVSAQNEWMSNHPEWVLTELKMFLAAQPELFASDEILKFAETVMTKKETAQYAFLWRLINLGRWMKLYRVKI